MNAKNKRRLKFVCTVANKLRKKSSVDMDLMERSLSKQLDYANSIKAKKSCYCWRE